MAGAIESSLGCPVVPIPNFAPDPNPEGTVSPPGDYYLFVGVLEPHKGLLEIARAAAGPSGLRVKVVGSGSLARHLADLQRNGAARIELEGWVTRERLTELYETLREKGVLPEMDWRQLYQDNALVGTDELSREELNKLRRLAYTKLYFNPRWWLQNLRFAFSSRDDFQLASRYGMRVLSNYFVHGMHGSH